MMTRSMSKIRSSRGQNQAGQAFEIFCPLDRPYVDAEAPEMIEMFADTPLKVQDADGIAGDG
jgi:hypothetical protein